jgi:SAM-dependent methyltransferase
VRALEIGCGSGESLGLLAKAGWDIEGVEIDEIAGRIAHDATRRTVHIGDFLELDLPPAAFDLIVMSHVFEHLPNALAALQRIHALLARGGRAVLTYPNSKSIGAWCFKDCWFPFEVPRHLLLPPGSALKVAASSQELRTESVRTSAEHASHYFHLSSQYLAQEKRGGDFRKSRLFQHIVLLLEKFLICFGCDVGDEVVVVLTRQ